MKNAQNETCYCADCLFSCEELQRSTRKLSEAIGWFIQGYEVGFYYKDKFVGNLNYYGEIEDFDEVYSMSGGYGSVVYVRNHGVYYINIPD